MSLPSHLEALKAEALQTSCIGWAIRKRWQIAKTGIDREGPCPVCGGKDRFAIHTVKDTFNCRRCGIAGHGVIDLVMKTENVEFTRACEIVTGRSASEPVDEQRAEAARQANAADEAKRDKAAADYREEARRRGYKILQRAVQFAPGDPSDQVTSYLGQRGIPPAALDGVKLGLIATHPWIEKQGNVWVTIHSGPAMIAAVQRPDGSFGAVHQTWLDPSRPNGRLVLAPAADGSERPTKKVIGAKKGGSIRLFTPGVPRRIVMGEGIETTLTAMAHNFEQGTAYWAGVDLGNMAGRDARAGDGTHLWGTPDLDDRDCFLPPDWCEELVYLCDSDEPRNHTEEKVIRGLRRALFLRELAREENPALPHLQVDYVLPIGDGKDLNDLVRVSPP